LKTFLFQPIFSFANVPYRIKRYADLLENPYNTIDFNWDLEHGIEARVKERGSDGRLVYGQDGKVLHANLTEKLLTLLLAKLVNFVPEGGVWMNTQRPEWNDANNALVGKGLSVVTLCYLRRTIVFWKGLLAQNDLTTVQVSIEIQNLFSQIFDILRKSKETLAGSFTDASRRAMMDALGQAGSEYRWNYYSNGLSGGIAHLKVSELAAFLDLTQQFVEHTLRANKRSDNLYHAYNILHLDDGMASIGHLNEMLEGQVAILSSGLLSGGESLALLESLRKGPLYCADQHSYILYPDKTLPGFLVKNTMTSEQVSGLELVFELVKANDKTLLVKDVEGNYHFAGQLRNVKDVTRALDALPRRFTELAQREAEKIKALFEDIFRHDEFTGRSGTFFAYEGLGSIYWHMVAKLLLAVQETVLRCRLEPGAPALLACYADIRQGLSFNKSPALYGAFPTDPYSHTPAGQGAKQPGMTGLVKEVILSRQAELGLSIDNGKMAFDALLIDRREFLQAPAVYYHRDVGGREQKLNLGAGSLAYTVCQTPVVIETGSEEGITLHFSDGTLQTVQGTVLDEVNSRHIFLRDGRIHHLVVKIRE
jgi:hypothetical protein